MEKNEYLTKDLHEAAAVLAEGQKLLRLDPQDDHFLFIFQGKEKCEEIANAFWSGELKVSAKKYADSLRTLKDRLFANPRM